MSAEGPAICGTAEVERIAQRIRSQSTQVTHRRRLPIGAEPISDEVGTHFRVWAPKSKQCAVEILESAEGRAKSVEALAAEGNGYFSGLAAHARAGTLYRLQIDEGSFPDPASRFQPAGPHGPSMVVDARQHAWQDAGWRGLKRHGQVIYEMHVGTFTREGTWRAAAGELPALRDLGITVIELMPVADFAGRFGWGYDGVNLFAPTRLYGDPEDYKGFIDRAHGLGIGVILDVVYNHLGPDGNHLRAFSEDYFSKRYSCEWGEAINFDGENSGPVREFFVSNARYWIEEFHLDGLRLDATQQIYDSSGRHIIAEVVAAARAAAGARGIFIVAENEPQQTRLVRPEGAGGCEVDALWNDDFHHSAVVAATGKQEAYYTDYNGSPQEFVSAAKWGYLYQGQWYDWQKQRRGTPALDLEPANFITFIENHDQVANTLRGERLHRMTTAGRLRALTALLLLGPGTPMLFQGQEFAATSPFLYFADHNPELAGQVASGRREFLNQFKSIAGRECDGVIAAPHAEETFRRSVLNLEERERHGAIHQLHRDLLRLRREDAVFGKVTRGGIDGAVLGPEAFLLRYFGEQGEDRLLVVNLGKQLQLTAAPEPLLAPPAGCEWKILISTESVCYGGGGTPEIPENQRWVLPGHAALALAPTMAGGINGETAAQNRPEA